MKSYEKPRFSRTQLNVNVCVEGEPIEHKIERVMNNKEPIKDGAPLIYTERKDGVKPEHDIRTDRWEIAVEAMDKVSRSYKARREDRINKGSSLKDDKVESTHGKSETDTPKSND